MAVEAKIGHIDLEGDRECPQEFLRIIAIHAEILDESGGEQYAVRRQSQFLDNECPDALSSIEIGAISIIHHRLFLFSNIWMADLLHQRCAGCDWCGKGQAIF